MVLKELDDKREIINALKLLLKHPKIYPSKKEKLRWEIDKIYKGWKNEKDASYYINTYYKDRDNVFVIHDLRLKDGNTTVQIDHLLVFTFLTVIFESKFFSSYLYYNWKNKEFFIRNKKGEYKAIANPIKQAERQSLEFYRFIKAKGLDKYIPQKNEYYVLISPKVKFQSKMPKKVIKADSFIDKFREDDKKMGIKEVFSRGIEALRHPKKLVLQGLQELISMHQPLTIDFYLKQHNLEWTKDWLLKEMGKIKK
jgi:DNA-binding cell septation regulator SpoVG